MQKATLFLGMAICTSFYRSCFGYEYNSTTPMPSSILSRFANNTKARLIIPYFVEYQEASMGYVPLGSQLAIEKLSTFTPYLSNFELQVNFYETFCDDATAVNGFMAVLEAKKINNLPYIATYACAKKGQELLAEVVNHYNFVATGLLDVVAKAVEDRSTRFGNYFTLGATMDTMHHTLLKFMKLQNWSRVALFGEDDLPYYFEVRFF